MTPIISQMIVVDVEDTFWRTCLYDMLGEQVVCQIIRHIRLRYIGIVLHVKLVDVLFLYNTTLFLVMRRFLCIFAIY